MLDSNSFDPGSPSSFTKSSSKRSRFSLLSTRHSWISSSTARLHPPTPSSELHGRVLRAFSESHLIPWHEGAAPLSFPCPPPKKQKAAVARPPFWSSLEYSYSVLLMVHASTALSFVLLHHLLSHRLPFGLL